MIPQGKKVIADQGYRSRDLPEIAGPNSHDTEQVREFKGRVKARQESFNKRLKVFRVLAERFRHRDIGKHKICFEAVAVICQYQLDNNEPLFTA